MRYLYPGKLGDDVMPFQTYEDTFLFDRLVDDDDDDHGSE